MNFKFSNEQKEIYQEIVNFTRENLNKEEDMNQFSFEMWKKVADFGLFGLIVPEEYGGMGESFITAAIAIEALGYGCKNNGFVFVINNHIWVALNLILQYGMQELKNKYLPDMVRGERIGAIAITEADAGSDATAMKASAMKVDGGFLLNGSKMFISNGPIADIFIVFANTLVDGNSRITGFVVEKGMEGVSIGKEIEKMGLHSCPTSEVTFHNCLIPEANILGRKGSGGILMNAALEWERCYEFACHVGAMQRVMEECITYASQRRQFGKEISANQAVSHKIADMKMKVELAKLMLYKIAWTKDQGKSAYIDTSIFKLFVSESYIQTCKDAMQIFGAYGYTREYGMENEMRDALASSIYSGTNEMQRNTIFDMIAYDVQG